MRYFLFVALLLICTPGAAFSAPDVVYVDWGNPPFMYGSGGSANGLYPAIIREAYRRIGKEVVIRSMPWKRVMAALEAGEAAAGGIYANSRRRQRFSYTEGINQESIVIYARKGEGFSFSSPHDLVGKRVGVIDGWTYGDIFDGLVADGEVDTVASRTDIRNIELLMAGRIDVFLAVKESAELVVAQSDHVGLLEQLAEPFVVHQAYLAFPKTRGNSKLVQSLNWALREMRKDGTMTQLRSVIISGE